MAAQGGVAEGGRARRRLGGGWAAAAERRCRRLAGLALGSQPCCWSWQAAAAESWRRRRCPRPDGGCPAPAARRSRPCSSSPDRGEGGGRRGRSQAARLGSLGGWGAWARAWRRGAAVGEGAGGGQGAAEWAVQPLAWAQVAAARPPGAHAEAPPPEWFERVRALGRWITDTGMIFEH